MNCDDWNERLIDRLYGESSPEDDAALSAHLAACSGCLERFRELEQTRDRLRAGARGVPVAPSRVLVLAPAPRGAERWALAASLAALGLLAGFGIASSWSGRGPEPVPSRAAATPPAVDAALRSDLERWFEERWNRAEQALDRAEPEPTARTAPRPADRPITRHELQELFAGFENRLERSREAEVAFLLTEVARTGQRLGEAQEAIRYLALASDPRLSEQ